MFEYSPPKIFLENKNIVITGASDGIGKQCARTFSEHGANLILLGRKQEKLEQLYDELEEKAPGRTVIQPLDFAEAKPEQYSELADALLDQCGTLDGLIHSAALLGPRTPIEYYPDSDWQALMQVNVTAPYLLSKALLPALRESKDARVLFLSSSVGRIGRAHWGAYAVSKFAVEGLMQTLADEIANTTSIRVNSLNPGGTRTAMRRDAYPAENPESQPEALEIMPVFLYLFSKEAQSLHGEAIDVRGFEPGK